MSFYHDSAENEAIEGLEGGVLSSHMSRQFTPEVLDHISSSVLPDAIKQGDKDLAEKCDRVLALYGLAHPNRVSGLWEPLEVPRSELQVRELFAHRLPEFGYQLVGSHTDFPDWLLLSDSGEYVYCEVEHRSSSFVLHAHDTSRCDLIACWEHDWPESPLPVLEFFSGKVIQPTTTGVEGKSRSRLSVNFSGRLSTPQYRPNLQARTERGEYAMRRYRELRDGELEGVSEHESNESIFKVIGRELGTTPSAVRQLLKHRGALGPVQSRRRQIVDKFDEVRGNYETRTAAVNAVADLFEITPATVWSHLSRVKNT